MVYFIWIFYIIKVLTSYNIDYMIYWVIRYDFFFGEIIIHKKRNSNIFQARQILSNKIYLDQDFDVDEKNL